MRISLRIIVTLHGKVPILVPSEIGIYLQYERRKWSLIKAMPGQATENEETGLVPEPIAHIYVSKSHITQFRCNEIHSILRDQLTHSQLLWLHLFQFHFTTMCCTMPWKAAIEANVPTALLDAGHAFGQAGLNSKNIWSFNSIQWMFILISCTLGSLWQ